MYFHFVHLDHQVVLEGDLQVVSFLYRLLLGLPSLRHHQILLVQPNLVKLHRLRLLMLNLNL
jgi:hypothetical protein